MIAPSAALSAAFMAALNQALGAGAKAVLYASARPAPGAAPGGSPVGQVLFADVAGTVTGGALVLAPGPVAVALASAAPVWARVLSGSGAWLFDCDARMGGAADAGQELVIGSGSVLQAGVSIQILSGSFSAEAA
jgi:hypothetical protein